ncbi:unnamed protein product, partial [Rotaria magnacalcarata]
SCVGLNDLGADSYPIDVPEQLEDEAGADSDNENLIDDDEVFRDGDNTTEVESDDDVENDTEDEDDLNGEGKQLDDEQLLQSENVRYLVLQLVKRIRACVANIRSTRAVNDHVKRKASSNEPPIKFALITDFETRWNTTFVMIDRFCIYRTIIDDTNSRPFKIVHISPTQQLKLVQYALRYFVSETSDSDSNWLKSLKACLREKSHLYFDDKINQHQKNNSLVGSKHGSFIFGLVIRRTIN